MCKSRDPFDQTRHEELQYCIKLGFPITNNAAKYEALLEGLKLAKKSRVDKF